MELLKNIKIQILQRLDWIKIYLTTAVTIYAVVCGLDIANKNFHNPLVVCIQWLLSWHPFVIFSTLSIFLLIISIMEKVKLGSYFQIKKKAEEAEQKLELLNNNIEELFNGLLMVFTNNELDFGANEQNHERISLYLAKKNQNSDIEHLYPMARYSGNPEYRKKQQRKQYPVNIGCIGEAYRNGYCYDGNVDENKSKQQYGYSDTGYNAIKMKSQTYAAIALKDVNNNVIGILVAESIDSNWQPSGLKDKLQKQAEYYAKIYTTLKDYIDSKVNTGDPQKGEIW